VAARLQSLLKASPRLLLEAGRALADRLGRQPGRPEQALRWVRDHALPGDPDSVLTALDDFGRNHRFLMNVGDEKGPLLVAELQQAIAGVSAPRVLELGCFCGYSAILMGSRLPAAGHLTSIELDENSVRAATQIIAHAGLGERITVLHGASGDVIPTLTGPFHLVFLDHWKDRYLDDLQAIERRGLLVPGSRIFADNVGAVFGEQPYLGYVRDSARYVTRYVEAHVEYTRVEDGVEISVFTG